MHKDIYEMLSDIIEIDPYISTISSEIYDKGSDTEEMNKGTSVLISDI